MTGVLDRQHCYRLNQLDMVVPDGQPVRWGINLLHRTGLKDRVYGPTLTLKVCEAASKLGLGIFLFGSDESTLDTLTASLERKFPGIKIVGKLASKFRTVSEEESEEIRDTIRNSGAHITLAGLGCPRQEIWAFENASEISMPVLAVGAAFAFHSGQLSQAPGWMQRRGLEWLYRLSKEPTRLWKRYVFLNPAYLTLLAGQATRLVRLSASRGVEPTSPCRFG
jgi:hypothetical protein